MKRFAPALAVACFAVTALAADDFCFPSMHPPGGLDPQDVPQFIVLGWDDNAYSGHPNTIYHSGGTWDKGGTEYKASAYPQGLPSAAVKAINPSSTPIVKETSYGLAWVEYLNRTYNVKGSFYYIAGQSESKDGYHGLTFEHPDGQSGQVPVVWGREHGYLEEVMKRLAADGNELGNHTLDHNEINVTSSKGLPRDYLSFGSEDYYGETDGHKGWMDKVGKQFTEMAWDSVLYRAEQSLVNIGLTENIGFRAPRLEINDNGLRALKKRGYLYDCSYEEGSQPNFTAARSLWPYTSDNGSPANAYSGEWGKPGTNYPQGLWLMNTPHLEIPDDLLPGIMSNWRSTSMGQSMSDYANAIEADKKIIAYDFNTLVMMGMTGDHFSGLLKYNLDQRYNSNRAPLLLGLHCDYFSPMYDEETLLMDPQYKDVLKYNNHQDRKDAIEDFLEYATSKPNVRVVTMKELIEWMAEQTRDETIPSKKDELGVQLGDWSLAYSNNADADVSSDNGVLEITWNLGKCVKSDWSDWPVGYVAAYNFDGLEGITHIEIEYEADNPFYFGVETSTINGSDTTSRPFKTLIGHAVWGEKRLSGPIPLRDFEPDYYDEDAWVKDWDQGYQGLEINPSEVTGFSFDHGIKGCENEAKTGRLKIHRIIAYGADMKVIGVSVVDKPTHLKAHTLGVQSANAKQLELSVPAAGNYGIAIYSLDGRMLFDKNITASKAGVLTTSLGSSSLSQSMYIVQITDIAKGSSTVSRFAVTH